MPDVAARLLHQLSRRGRGLLDEALKLVSRQCVDSEIAAVHVGDEGGIVCHIVPEGKPEGLIMSLTHVRVPRTPTDPVVAIGVAGVEVDFPQRGEEGPERDQPVRAAGLTPSQAVPDSIAAPGGGN